jgi:hypothetical protein
MTPMRVEPPVDPRAAGVRALQRFMELPGDDAEARADRRLLRRMDIREALKS